MSVPETKSSEITDKINLLSQQSDVSPFEVKSLQREIDQLRKFDAGEAYMLNGMLCSVLGEYERSKDYHEKTLKLRYSVVEIINYAVSMKRLGRSRESLALYIRASEMDPGTHNHYGCIFQLMTFVGDFEEVEAILARFKKANPGFDTSELHHMKTINSIRRDLAALGVPESEFKIAGALVEKAISEFGFNCRQMSSEISNFDGVNHLYVELAVEAKSASDLVGVNDRVVELILGCEELTCWDKLVYNIIGFHSNDAEKAA
ncbi:tetratricopeptide repeat protein [Pseudomonas alliivorans]|nr:tetratricopeptide repeat protein [Pseudomonas alliivorans]MEE4921489.1 tetratricopeptide repeat protein [Pseudomonas alliivorans]